MLAVGASLAVRLTVRELPYHTMVKLCPICSADLSKCAPRGLTFHARGHGLTPQQLYDRVHGAPPVCCCGCGLAVAWIGWHDGYASMVRGHRTPALNAKASKTLKAGFAAGAIKHWTATNPNASSIARAAGLKTSVTLADGFASGRIKHWTSGRNAAAVCARLSTLQRCRTHQSRRWSQSTVRQRVLTSLGSEFTIVSGLDAPAARNVEHWLHIGCTSCGHIQRRSVYGIVRCKGPVPCWNCCANRTFCSAAERELGDYVSDLVASAAVLRQNRSVGPELDIYVPSYALAIEHNGLYWHSEANVDRHYHQRKSDVAALHGIRLLHVFEDEWRDKSDIIRSMVSARLGMVVRLNARELAVCHLTHAERAAFFTENHVDGDVRAPVAFGLRHGDTIVAAASFRRAMHYDAAELARFATLRFTCVRGAISRLVNAYVKSQPGRLITYADQRFGMTHGYERSGFRKIGETGERFWWTDRTRRFDRSICTADAERDISELEASSERKLLKIWGCKNSVYELMT